MTTQVPFDAFADVYEAWCASAAPVTDANRRFYVEEYEKAGSPVVELGVGDGRIAVEAARRGLDVIGVDSSPAMLALCRERFAEAGVSERLTAVQADFRDFRLPAPARLVAIPFHTIGLLVSPDAKREALRNVHGQLVPGGRLVFDHFVCDLERARRMHGVPVLRAEFVDRATGRDSLLWTTTLYDFDERSMRLVTWTDRLDAGGEVVGRRYRRIDFSWLDPEEARRLLEETGFEVEHLWGTFERAPLDETSDHQVWVARR